MALTVIPLIKIGFSSMVSQQRLGTTTVPLGVLVAVSVNSGKDLTEIATGLLGKSCDMIFLFSFVWRIYLGR
jgi:hypothetical protein